MKKLSTFIGAAALLASGSASAIVVGGVDFGALGGAPQQKHLETTTLASTFIDINAPASQTQTLLGYGQVNTVNGNAAYAGGNKLYYVFSYNFAGFDGTRINFDSGSVDFYLGSLGNLLDQDSVTNMTNITGLNGGSTWVELDAHADSSGFVLQSTGQFTGATLSFSSAGLLDVDTAAGVASVAAYLDASDVADGLGGFADMVLTSSGNNFVLNNNDDLTGCNDGTATSGQWCLAGSADIRGSTVVPEPSIIALLGVGLLGFRSTLRKK